MTYPGNPSLAPEARERVESTFANSLQLVTEGKDQEAILGCEFILRMDPEFAPAQTLMERIRSGERPIRTDDLGSDAPAAAPPSAGGGLASVLQDLIERRNFQQVLQIAQSQKGAIEKNASLRALVQVAQEKLESAGFVEKFLEAAERSRAEGDEKAAQGHLDKARALDPDHPGIRALSGARAAAASEAEDLTSLQEESLELTGDEDVAESFAMEDADDLATLDDDLEALDLDDDLEVPEDPGDSTRPVVPLTEEPTEQPSAAAAEPPPEPVLGSEAFGDLQELEDLEDLEGDDLLDFDDAEAFAGEAIPEPAEEPAASTAEAPEEPQPETPESSDGDEDLEVLDGMELPGAGDDFTSAAGAAAAEVGDDDSQNIERLLAEGKEAYAREEYQNAIDIWSRIFLIDIDNGEASRLIEEARKKKSELDRQAEELFHEATDQIESQDLEDAKATLQQVLELQPEHSVARDYLDQLEAGKVPTVARRSSFDEEGGIEDLAADSLAVGSEGGPQSLEAAVERDRVVVIKRTDKKLVGLGLGVLILVVGGIGFLATQWDRLFPNTEAPPAAAPREVDPIERATTMKEEGRTENAIALLRKVQPGDPAYGEAQALIDQWTPLIADDQEGPSGPSEALLAQRKVLLEAARRAHEEQRHLRARKYFDRAHRIFPLEADDLALKRQSEDALSSLVEEVRGFDEGLYERILPELWRKHEETPESHDIRRLIVDSYYNLSLLDLQRGDPQGASEKIEEARQLEPDNEELERIHLFAETYKQRPQDLVYRIFVKYLPSRS